MIHRWAIVHIMARDEAAVERALQAIEKPSANPQAPYVVIEGVAQRGKDVKLSVPTGGGVTA